MGHLYETLLFERLVCDTLRERQREHRQSV
jgi:hypothetical protein